MKVYIRTAMNPVISSMHQDTGKCQILFPVLSKMTGAFHALLKRHGNPHNKHTQAGNASCKRDYCKTIAAETKNSCWPLMGHTIITVSPCTEQFTWESSSRGLQSNLHLQAGSAQPAYGLSRLTALYIPSLRVFNASCPCPIQISC